MPIAANNIETWNAIAKRYEDKFMDLDIYNQSYLLFCKHLSKNSPFILDVGCGPGNISLFLKRQIPNSMIQGIDSSQCMIELAKKNVSDAEFMQMDSKEIGNMTNRFDGLVCGFCIPYLAKADTDKFLMDCEKVILPEGILYLSYVDGKYEDSHFQTGSTGHKLFFHYYETDFLLSRLEKFGFKLLENLTVQYKKADGSNESHSILILNK